MRSAQSSTAAIVPRLMATIKELTPTELRDFKRTFAAWEEEGGVSHAVEEEALVKACQARLPAADEQRLKALINCSELGSLHPSELKEYRRLVRRAEKLDAARLTALTQLASRWGKPLSDVMASVGWESGVEAEQSQVR
jgi:hypothetical protein